jgi:CheY-like chemotaxis protein
MNQSGPVRGHILAIDDQQPNLTLLTQMLEAEGHIVRTAVTGLSALEAIDRQPPDLILLDVGLPDINGFEVCRRLKHNPSRG